MVSKGVVFLVFYPDPLSWSFILCACVSKFLCPPSLHFSLATLSHTHCNNAMQWAAELKHHADGVPILLVGTKLDQREDPEIIKQLSQKKAKPISSSEGQQMGREIHAVGYVECSAKTQKGLKDVFDTAIKAVLTPTATTKPKEKKSCIVL